MYVRKFLFIVTLLMFSGCSYQCIKLENSSVLQDKLDVVSTEQRWVNSGIRISDSVKVIKISIALNKISFCSKCYEDFIIQPGEKKSVILSRFAFKEGDKIRFNIVGSKVCKNKSGDAKIRRVRIDEKCSGEEKEYFARILNQNECEAIWTNGEYKYSVCPNKYIIGDLKKLNWLDGKEYWSLDFSELYQNEREMKFVIDSIKQQKKNINCGEILESQIKELDNYILNLACGNIYKFYNLNKEGASHAYIEYHNKEYELFNDITTILNKSGGKFSDGEIISDPLRDKEIKIYVPCLKIYMDDEYFECSQHSGTYINYDHKVKKDHPEPKLTFDWSEINGKGGYNIRVTRVLNPTRIENSLYIRVTDTFPEHDPDENNGDIPINIERVYDTKYMEDIKEKLKNKIGTIYYGVRNHGCNYNENEGQFNIKIKIKKPPKKTLSIIYNFFDEKVKTIFFSSNHESPNIFGYNLSPVKSLYQSFVALNKTKTIRSTIVSLLVLYIVLYTLYYFFGLTHISIYEFLIICVKIGVIIQLLRDNSWDFFYDNAFSIFIDIPKQLMEAANFRGTALNIFEFLDLPLGRFLSLNSVLLIISLIFSGPLGIVSFFLVIWGLIVVVLSIFHALFSFITSITIVALLLCMTPTFIVCLLFKYTRQMFHNWIKNLARFAIHPVVLLIFISLIIQAMDYITYSVFNFEVCTTCILNINIKIFELCILYGYASKHIPNISSIIAFVILCHAMKALVEASSKISDSLFSAFVHEEPSKQYQQSLMGLVGLDRESVYRRRHGFDISQLSDVIPKKKLELPRIQSMKGSRGVDNVLR